MSEDNRQFPVRLLAVDMDGTLFKSDDSISPASMAALKGLIAEKILVIPASGRVYGGIPRELLDAGAPFVISANGASIMETSSETCIYESEMSHKNALALLECLLEFRGYAYVQYQDHYYGDNRYFEEAKRHHSKLALAGADPMWMHLDLLRFLKENKENVQKIGFLAFDKESEERILALPGIKEQYNVMVVDSLALEFNSRETSKGAALACLCRYLDISPKEVMAIGDSENDISMLDFAQIGIAMDNASQLVKEHADYITKSNDQEGVLWAIEQWLR